MKKIFTKYFSGLALFFIMHNIHAQVVSAYSFSSFASTYTTISGGTVLGSNSNDDDTFDGIPIGFTFNFGGGNFTQLSANANGYIKFLGILNNFAYQPISSSFADDTIVSALGADIASNAGGVLMYLTSGIAPNREFVIQWQDYSSFFNMDTLNFQIRLHETTNKIDVYYEHFYVDVNNTYEVGLRGILANSDFNNRSVINNNNTWATSNPGILSTDYCELDPNLQFAPVSGQQYEWTPPPPCSGPPNAGTATATSTLACVNQTIGLNLIGSTIASGLTYQWESSPNSSVWTAVPSATDMVYNTTFTTNIYYHCIVACGVNTAVSTPVYIISQTANTYTTVPYLENFDNTWQNRCDLRNVPVSANWDSNPTTGNNSWRRQDDGVSANWSSNIGINTPLAGAGCANFHTWDAFPSQTGDMSLYVNLGSNTSYQMSFYYINQTGNDSLEVFLSTDGGNTFTKKAGFNSGDYTPADLNWNQKIINLGAANSTSCVVKFTATSDFGADDIGIDSLKINCASPNMTLTASQATVCGGTTVSLTANGATTYTWNTNATVSSITVTPFANTTYTVVGENVPGCGTTKTININVKPSPTILLSAFPSVSICPGGSASLIASGALSYTWTPGNQNTSIINVTPSTSTTYFAAGTNSLGCVGNSNITMLVFICTDLGSQTSAIENINIFPNPTNGEFTLEFANGLNKAIEIIDVTGRIVCNQNTLEDKINLNISALSNGVYYVKVRSNNAIKVMKVVKE